MLSTFIWSSSVSPTCSYRCCKSRVFDVLCLEFRSLVEVFLGILCCYTILPSFIFPCLKNHVFSNQFKLIARISVKFGTFPFSDYQLQPGNHTPTSSQFPGRNWNSLAEAGILLYFSDPFYHYLLGFSNLEILLIDCKGYRP